MSTTVKDLYAVGEMPPLGHVPAQMYANLIPENARAEPKDGFQVRVVDVPSNLKPDEVLVYVMAAGVNYNNVWASRGIPLDMATVHRKDGDDSGFHIGGSDGSGIVWAVGGDVTNVKVGDHVVMHCGQWDRDDPYVKAGGDPILAPSNKIWGYESNFGSFAQFTRVQSHQCLPKAKHLSWEGSAAYMLVGATAYRMLTGWSPHTVKPGDVVLIWGGAGGLGVMAIQLVKEMGGIPVAVVSSESKFEYCINLGAKGCINRKDFDHWGQPPHWTDDAGFAKWSAGARAFGKALWDVVGERKNPRIVFEHPGEDTVPTSMFVCDNGGMVVICAGTTGYSAVVDLRYLWMRQKRFQGSHFANDEQCAAFNQLVIDGKIDPCVSRVFPFEEIGLAHQLMFENKHAEGNMVCLVGAPEAGLTDVP